MLVCFDIGGVLIRICRTWDEGCLAAGVPIRPFETDPDHIARRQALVMSLQRGELEDGAFHQQLSDLFDGTWSREEVACIDEAWLLGPYDATTELVRELEDAGVRTACLSNTSAGHWEALLSFENVDRLSIRHASHLLGMVKPDPRIYAEFERLVGVCSNEVVFFDDLDQNIETATVHGWDAVSIDHQGDTAKQMRAALRERNIL